MLRVEGLVKSFDDFIAVNGATLTVQKGEIAAVIGPNGAGKTTLFNLITGQLKRDRGKILFKGEDISGWAPYQICQKGIGRSFQIANIFPRLTVFENVQVGLISRLGKSPNFVSRAKNIGREEVTEILATVGLSSQADSMAGTLSYGDQRIMEIAIAMASRPSLLLLDEPTAGMGPQETLTTGQLIKSLTQKHGLTILLVEHDMEVVFSVSDVIVVMHQGEAIAMGKPQEIRENEKVVKIYLGDVE